MTAADDFDFCRISSIMESVLRYSHSGKFQFIVFVAALTVKLSSPFAGEGLGEGEAEVNSGGGR
jgi:hypothetical protein